VGLFRRVRYLPNASSPWINPTIDVVADRDSTVQSIWTALLGNLALIALFTLQHSIMARPQFKSRLTRYIPHALERTVYVYAACVAGFLLLVLWEPVPHAIWSIEHTASEVLLWAGFTCGWLLLAAGALSMDMFELLGLRQAWTYYLSRPSPRLSLKTTALYHLLSHPMYVGVLLGLWCTPSMTAGHLLLALALTGYIAVGVRLEERDLQRRFGAAYTAWRTSSPTPSAGIPPPLKLVARDLRTFYRPICN
jgi:protein-S-isoprenylcysteine O-methyltransferase Ste14